MGKTELIISKSTKDFESGFIRFEEDFLNV